MHYTTREKVDAFEAVIGVFSELFKELKDLGKRHPGATLGATKVKIINRVLEDVRSCLFGEPDYKYLDLLDHDDLPQYSDAILILSQHEGALKSFKARSHGYRRSTQTTDWFVDTHGWHAAPSVTGIGEPRAASASRDMGPTWAQQTAGQAD